MGYNRFINVKIQFAILLLSFIILVDCNKDKSQALNNANNWKTIYQNSNLDFISIKFLDKDNGFVLAALSGLHDSSNWLFVLSTNDGGVNWNQITCSSKDSAHQLPLYDLTDLFPLSKNVLFSKGYHVHKSIDIGKTWIDVTPKFPDSRIADLQIIDNVTWLVLAVNNIYRTNNAGQSWQTVFNESIGPLNCFSFSSLNVGYANSGYINPGISGTGGVNYGNIIKTTDGGQSWSIIHPEPWKSNNATLRYIDALQFVTDYIGYMSTNSQLYKTIDGGNNWTLVNKNNSTSGLEYFISENVGYFSDGQIIYTTINGGKSWIQDYSIGTDYQNGGITNWAFVKTGQGFAITRDHRIIKKN